MFRDIKYVTEGRELCEYMATGPGDAPRVGDEVALINHLTNHTSHFRVSRIRHYAISSEAHPSVEAQLAGECYQVTPQTTYVYLERITPRN